jgi:hypothetical protein
MAEENVDAFKPGVEGYNRHDVEPPLDTRRHPGARAEVHDGESVAHG